MVVHICTPQDTALDKCIDSDVSDVYIINSTGNCNNSYILFLNVVFKYTKNCFEYEL